MLVKQSVVENWYRKDSLVYKNFSFLFQNPIWNKSVPRGFSVCPYFWLSLFSLCIFRPFFVAPLQYVLLPILRLMGKRGAQLDNLAFRILNKVFRSDTTYWTGLGTCMSLVSVVMVALAASLTIWGYGTGTDVYRKIQDNNVGLFGFWSALSFVGLGSIILLHKKLTNTECKTGYYLFGWFILFLLAIPVFIPSETWSGVTIGAGAVWSAIVATIGVIGKGLWWAGWGIGVAFKYTGIFLWKFFTYAPWLSYVPWWAYLLVMTAIGWAGALLMPVLLSMIPEPKFAPIDTTLSPEELRASNRGAWSRMITSIIFSGKHWKNNDDLYEQLGLHHSFVGSDKFVLSSLKLSSYYIERAVIESMFGAELDKLQEFTPKYSLKEWDAIVHKDNDTRMRSVYLQEFINNNPEYAKAGANIKTDSLALHGVIQKVVKNDQEIRRGVIDLIKSYEAGQKAYRESWHYKACVAFTSFLAQMADVFFTCIGEVILAIKKIATLVWYGIKQVGVFFAYLWILVKAKKSGACPYFQFTDGREAKK